MLNDEAVSASADRRASRVARPGSGRSSSDKRALHRPRPSPSTPASPRKPTRKFARDFTADFDALCWKYPIDAEFQNLFELGLSALVHEEGLADRVGWDLTCFGNPQAFAVELGEAPKEVQTVVSSRAVNRSVTLIGVSGGVRVQPASLVRREAIDIPRDGALGSRRAAAAAKKPAGDNWWWD